MMVTAESRISGRPDTAVIQDAKEKHQGSSGHRRYVSQRGASNGVESAARTRSPVDAATQRIRVALGGFDPVFSVGLVCVLGEDQGLEVLQQEPGEAFEELFDRRAPDIAVLDGADRDTLDRLREAYPAARLLVLAAGLTGANAVRHLGLGTGCLSPAARPQEIRDAIRRAVATERPFVWLDGQRLEPRCPSDAPPLTGREQEVLERLLNGLLNKEIAREMDISVRTVEVHMAQIRRKFGVASKRELVARLAWWTLRHS
jgi:DNA-binding NarL/FixJ family response regulator